MKKLNLMFILSLSLACATPQTSYKPLNGKGIYTGFEDTKISNNVYRIRFVGVAGTDQTIIYKMFLRRCSELGLQNKQNYFLVKDVNTNPVTAGMLGVVMTYPQYEGTVTFSNKKHEDSFNALEISESYKTVKN